MNHSESDTIDRPGPFPAGPIAADSFSREELEMEEAILSSLVGNSFPDLDTSPGGSFFEGFIRPGAVVLAAARKSGIRFRESMTLDGVSRSGFNDLDEEAVSTLLSNYLLDVDSGDTASGEISIQLSSDRLVVIPRGASFSTADGVSFISPTQVSAGPGDMVSDGAGTWTFRIPAVAEIPGESGNILRGEQLSTPTTISSLIRIYASVSFSGGRSGASSEDLKSMVMSSISTRGMSSPNSILAVLRDRIPSVDRVSVTGPYHPLMVRNRHGAGGMPLGGFEDVYVRASRTIETRSIEGTATRISGRVYRLNLDSSSYPGHYDVASIRPSGSDLSGSFDISSFVRGVDPEWPGASSSYPLREALPSFVALSEWQTSVTTFTVPEGSDYGESFEVLADVWGIPFIRDAQQVVSDPDLAQVGIDRLVKAPVPCLVSMSKISVGLESGSDRSEVKVGIESAFSSEVSRSTPRDGVRSERLISAFMDVPGVKSLDVPLTLTGNVLSPTGEIRTFSSKSSIQIFDEPNYGYGPDNAEFFPDPGGVSIDFSTR